MTIQRFSRIEVVENRGYTGAWVTEADHEAEIERLRRRMQEDPTASAERASEAMRWACIAGVEALPIAIYSYRPDESLRDVGVWKSSLITALRQVQP